nr:exosortase/archaeosortase family protein [Acidobacteriota bacterium]
MELSGVVYAAWKLKLAHYPIVFVYATTLSKLGYDWWTDENYSHGLLIPLIIGYIVWADRERLDRESSRPSSFWGGLIVVFAMLCLWVGTAGAELYVQRMSLVLMLAGIVIYFWGWRLGDLPEGLVVVKPPIKYLESLSLMASADGLLVIDAPAEKSVFLP